MADLLRIRRIVALELAEQEITLAPEVIAMVLGALATHGLLGEPLDGAGLAALTYDNPARVTQRPAELRPRRWEIARLLGDGLGAQQIAQRLGLGVAAVRTQLSGLYATLGVSTAAGAVQAIWSRGWMDMPGEFSPSLPADDRALTNLQRAYLDALARYHGDQLSDDKVEMAILARLVLREARKADATQSP